MSDRPDVSDADEGKSGPGITKWIIIAVAALAGLVILALVIALLGGLSGSEGVAAAFRVLRDFFIIVLALQGILISIALVVLVLQLTALINLLRNEIKPIIDETRQTATTVRGTAQFVSDNVASPVIKVSAAVAGARAFVGELAGIRRNVNGEHRGNGRKK
jgi:hypothetical protein